MVIGDVTTFLVSMTEAVTADTDDGNGATFMRTVVANVTSSHGVCS